MTSVNELWGAKRLSDFPGPQPISVERKHMSNIQHGKYLVGQKDDGVRYALCCLQHDRKNKCILISRTLDCYLVRMNCAKQCFEGTVIDCEMVGNRLVLFDCSMINGTVVKTSTFHTRLEACSTFIDCVRSSDFVLNKKEFVNTNEINGLESSKQSDGLIFMPISAHVTQGTHTAMYKWKPRLMNTIDFWTDGKSVHLQNNGKHVLVKLTIDTESIPDLGINGCIVECMYVEDKSWKALQIRRDKTLPNSRHTYDRTLVNIKEDIKIDEFV